jgi:carboxypeptidase PM20D1
MVASRKRTVLVLAGAVALLAALLAVRALLFRSRQLVVEPVAPPPVDVASAALHLSQALRFPTISHEDPAENDPAAFEMLRLYLREAYPRIDAELERRTVSAGSLLYTWRGEEADLPPVVLMAHQDVVPIEPGTEDSWTHPPFGGVVEGGFVWGRGAMDDKGALIAVMEAVELLLSEGFKPRRTIHLAFGHDEEVGGTGAAAIAGLLEVEGVRPYFVLDEGGAIVEGMLPGLTQPLATVGVAEKGAVSVPLTVEVDGGHSSMPPRHTAIGILSRALVRLEDNPVPGGIQGPFRDMLETVGREMAFPRRLVLANLWLFRPLVERQFGEIRAADTMMRTSTAVTIVEGGVKSNVLPSKARAVVNFRIAPGDSVASVLDHVRRVVADPRVEVQDPREAREPSPVAPTDSDGFRLVERTVRELFPDAVVAPYLLPGGTDSRHYTELTESVYRFAAMRIGRDDLPRAHGKDERLSIDGLAQMTAFYVQLLRAVQPERVP